MEDIAEGILKLAAKGLLAIVRFIIFIAWEGFGESLFWYLAWPAVRVITFGYLPKQSITNLEEERPVVVTIVAITGLSYTLYLAYALVKYLKS